MKNNKVVKVSEQFVEIYKNFNVIDQTEKMKLLSKRELYLLITVCLDKFSDNDPVIKKNISTFREETLNIFDIQDEKKVDDEVLTSLVEETGDSYIETDYIEDIFGNKLPEPLSKEEVRDKRIDIIGK